MVPLLNTTLEVEESPGMVCYQNIDIIILNLVKHHSRVCQQHNFMSRIPAVFRARCCWTAYKFMAVVKPSP